MREREAPHPECSFEEQFEHGVELFNRREFFECHDAFEELWQEERGEMRLFLQALIQAAVGCYHLMNGNTTGAISQYRKSLAKLADYPESYLGIDAARLANELSHCLAGAEAMMEAGVQYDVDGSYFPLLHRSDNFA
jgi:predicted metal-dependent hydrolase